MVVTAAAAPPSYTSKYTSSYVPAYDLLLLIVVHYT